MKIKALSKFLGCVEIYIFSVSLIIYCLIECYLKFFNQTTHNVLETQLIKGGVLLITLVLVLRKRVNFIFTLAFFLIFYSIGQFFTDPPFSYNSFVVFMKLIFTISTLSLFHILQRQGTAQLFLYSTFEWILVFNSIFIIFAFFLKIDLASTYAGGRFGFNGFFSSSATGTYLYIIYILSFLMSPSKKPRFGWKAALILLSCIFIGTKALYGTMFFALFYLLRGYIKSYKNREATIIYYISSAIVLFAFTLIFKEFLLNNNLNHFFSKLISYRDILFFENTLPYVNQKWDFINYLFGGVDNYDLRAQMEFFDVFFFFGLVGGLFYFWVFYSLLLRRSHLSRILIFISLVFFISGNFFSNSFVALAICVFKSRHDDYYTLIERPRINILNAAIDNLTMNETLGKIQDCISSTSHISHSVVNAGKLVSIQSDLKLRQSVNNSDLINADGQAVVWASKFLGLPLKERVSGIDLMINLVKLASKKNYKIFFFGAEEKVLLELINIYSIKYSKDIIAGFRNGYFKKEEEKHIAKQIASSGANILFVAISSPTKENFLYTHRKLLSEVNFIMGVGGSFDVIAGKVKRAPLWLQTIGLEWLYRLYQEPKRMWRRYLIGNCKFILLVLREKFLKLI
tara:strand:- start:65 stop:1948 length:1884 start_codon:yes stop_codon:yes gene_type:complete